MDWHKHKPGDPMPVDGDTVVEVRFRGGNESGRLSARAFDWGKFDNAPYADITAYRVVEPAKPSGWVSVEDEPHPIGEWFWTLNKGEPTPCYAEDGKLPHVKLWHPMEQPPAFTPPAPLTDAEDRVREWLLGATVGDLQAMRAALAKIRGAK